MTDLDFRKINLMVAELAVLDFYPSDIPARAAIVRLVGNMANSEEEVRWLIDRATGGMYKKWPGVAELRALFCSHFKPRDGYIVYSDMYPDGYPHQQKALMIEAPPMPKRTPEEQREYEQWARDLAATIREKIKEIPKPPRVLTDEEKVAIQAEHDRLMRERKETVQ